MGTGEARAAAAPGNPPALHPPAAAPARLMRQEQEAPRERQGHPGEQWGRGRPGEDEKAPPARRRAEGRELGVGSGCLCPCPLGLPGRRHPCSIRPRVLLPLRWERRGGHGGLSSSHTRTHASPSLTHTRSHSLTHSLSHTLKQKGSAAQQPVPPHRGGGRALAQHGRGCRKNVAKPPTASGPPSSGLPRQRTVPAGARTPRAAWREPGSHCPKLPPNAPREPAPSVAGPQTTMPRMHRPPLWPPLLRLRPAR